jgi:hypothetical protein
MAPVPTKEFSVDNDLDNGYLFPFGADLMRTACGRLPVARFQPAKEVLLKRRKPDFPR